MKPFPMPDLLPALPEIFLVVMVSVVLLADLFVGEERKGVPYALTLLSLAGAGSVLIGFTAACIVAGTLIGWAAGNPGYGLAFGAVVGIPVGVAATVIKYRNI